MNYKEVVESLLSRQYSVPKTLLRVEASRFICSVHSFTDGLLWGRVKVVRIVLYPVQLQERPCLRYLPKVRCGSRVWDLDICSYRAT